MAFGFFDRQKGLPHPPIPDAVFLLVEKALCAAWQLMRTNPRNGVNLSIDAEDIITHELYERLTDEVFCKGIVDGFDRTIFTCITRESKLRNHSASKLDKMPDLLIGLAGRMNVFKPSQDWLFAECKLVDKAYLLRVHYCDKGIVRFTAGEYAWAMTNALMIGYVRSINSATSFSLAEVLKASQTVHTLGTLRWCSKSRQGQYSFAVCISRHNRRFSYVETQRVAPPITIRHLWLKCT